MSRTLEQFVAALNVDEQAAVARERRDALLSVFTYRWQVSLAMLIALALVQYGLFSLGYTHFAVAGFIVGVLGLFLAEPERFSRWRWQRPLCEAQQAALIQGPVALAPPANRQLYTADYMLCLHRMTLGLR